ncbi:hypothetical protein GZH53_15210 [Flavihumibacter sp. R14]|nr:hypothetical protein [Flavihumibacter soli]
MNKQVLYNIKTCLNKSLNKLSLLTFLLFISYSVFGQNDKAKDKEAYYKAWELRREGEKYFTKDPAKAAKLFKEANIIYPGNPDASSGVPESRDRLPALLIHHGDINGANKAIEEGINRLKSRKDILVSNGISSVYIPAANWIRKYHLLRAAFNLTYGDADLASKDIQEVIELGFDKKDYNDQHTTWSGGLGSARINFTFQSGQYIAFLNEDKQLIERLQPVFESMQDQDYITTGKIYLAILNKEYDKGIALAKEFEETGANNRINARFLIAWCYAVQKQTDKSNEYIKLLLKGIRVGQQTVARINALNTLNEGKYQEAIGFANASLKPIRYMHLSFEQPGKFFFFTVRAQAYAGLKLYEKAKADYEQALLYNQNYEPAITGLAKLESNLITERKTDKTIPQIVITEPAQNRGLKISKSGSDMMIKGQASDPSGIKSVEINGVGVFSQPDGVFWGSIPLHEGINKISIRATDMAGNTASESFEIEQQSAPVKENEIVPVERKEAKNYALIIAAQNYDDSSIPSLENPVSDAIKLKLILKNNYSFADDNIYTLFNPVVTDFKKKFAEINDLLQPDDNLIIFYAGHGIWNENEKKGYWLLTDAKRNDVNTWLSNKLVLEMIAKIPSRHTLLITDACFSGSVFKTRSIGADAPVALREMSEKISRVAITSGNDTEVPDESVFMKYLVKALSENKEKYLTAQKMFITQIIEAVMTESKTEPRYGTLELAGHVGGDFIFSKK